MSIAYIFDLDGVVYRGSTLISGAIETISYLQRTGHRVIFLTNNATSTRYNVAKKLVDFGISCSEADVINSAYGTAVYILKTYGKSSIYAIGEQGLLDELVGQGHTIVDGADANNINAEIVVVGLDRAFTYEKLAKGLSYIIKGAIFIATNTDALLPTEDGFLPGAGSIVSSLATASGTEPLVVGKPHKLIMDIVINYLNVAPHECVMVGDRLDTDILGAVNAGMGTILVLTGAETTESVKKSVISADIVLDSIADIISHVEKITCA